MPKKNAASRQAVPPWMQGGFVPPVGAPMARHHSGGTLFTPEQVHQIMQINHSGHVQQVQPSAPGVMLTFEQMQALMGTHQHRGKTRKQARAEALNATRKLAKANGMPSEFKTAAEASATLNQVGNLAQIHVEGRDQLKRILSRYITKKGWVQADVATIVGAMTGADAGDFAGDWTPAKMAASSPKIFRKLVKSALQDARRYVKRHQESTLPVPHAKEDARFTSMRF